ncbi:MAG: hypothetical protein WCO75_09485 [Planctomycetota bacterium]
MIAAKTKIRMNTSEAAAPRCTSAMFVPRIMTLGGRSNARARLAGLAVIARGAALRDAASPALRDSATL